MTYASWRSVAKLGPDLVSDLVRDLVSKPQFAVVRLLWYEVALWFWEAHELGVVPYVVELLLSDKVVSDVNLVCYVQIGFIYWRFFDLIWKPLQDFHDFARFLLVQF